MKNKWFFQDAFAAQAYDNGPFARAMWLLCAFDLPTDTSAARAAYATFRKELLKAGFNHLQHSVYCRHFSNFEQARAVATRFGKATPVDGKTDFFFFTDKQMGITMSFYGNTKYENASIDAPNQGLLF